MKLSMLRIHKGYQRIFSSRPELALIQLLLCQITLAWLDTRQIHFVLYLIAASTGWARYLQEPVETPDTTQYPRARSKVQVTPSARPM